MFLDKENQFSSAQAITASAASTNLIDLGDAKDHAVGQQLPLNAMVVTNFASNTSLTVALQTDDNTGFSSATTVSQTGAVPVASLVAGYTFTLAIPFEGLERYIRLYYTIGGSNASAGAVTAGIVVNNEQSFA